jgi:soluble lytic murein transglycosylase
VSAAIGLAPLEPGDLYRPEIALALGAAYVGELIEQMGGSRHAAVASYNAGPPAAALWQSYCYSGELAEYYTKVSYGETRNYLAKVLSSWAQYREIYGAPAPEE